MQRDSDVLPVKDRKVPYDKRVRTCLLRLEHLAVSEFLFVIFNDGVEGDKHSRAILVGMAAEPLHLLHAVSGRLSCPECGPCNIYCIGTAVDGCDADISVSGRCQKFKCLHYLSELSSLAASAPYLGSVTAFW